MSPDELNSSRRPRCSFPIPRGRPALLKQSSPLLYLLLGCLSASAALANNWNQWMGGPGRTLTTTSSPTGARVPLLTERWRVPLGSGVSGVSVWETNAVTGTTDGRQDGVVMLDATTGRERWRVNLGRTRKRGEGTPLGPLSTPAIDETCTYMQALDGRFVCLDNQSGAIKWEVQVKRDFKAFEPGYGFASSPLLLRDSVILMPSGSSGSSIVSLDRATGKVRWQTSLGSGTEYSSATFLQGENFEQIVAHVAGSMAGVDRADGRVLWKVDGVQGGLWTASVLKDGRVFLPLGFESQLLRVSGQAVKKEWSSPIFENIMGPVVEVNGILVGHQKRKLTGVDADTGTRLWQLPESSDGQLLALGQWLIFYNDRTGKLNLMSVDRAGIELRREQFVTKPTRMETPLTFAGDTLYLRATTELIALKVD